MAPPLVTIYVTSLTSAPKVRKYIELLRSSLRALEIRYEEYDLVMDEEAKKRWQRSKPPGVVVGLPGYLVGGEWVGTMEDFEDAVETQTLETFLKQDLDLSAPASTQPSSSTSDDKSSSAGAGAGSAPQRSMQDVELEKLMNEMTDKDLDQLIADLDVSANKNPQPKSKSESTTGSGSRVGAESIPGSGAGIGKGLDDTLSGSVDPTFGTRVGAGAGGSGMGGKGEDTGSELVKAALNGSSDAGYVKEKEGTLVEQVREKVGPAIAEDTANKKLKGDDDKEDLVKGLNEDKEDEDEETRATGRKSDKRGDEKSKGGKTEDDIPDVKETEKELLDQNIKETALEEKEDRDILEAEKVEAQTHLSDEKEQKEEAQSQLFNEKEKEEESKSTTTTTTKVDEGFSDVRQSEKGLLDDLKNETQLEDKEEKEIEAAVEQ
ncbi:hypothetical protein CI109_100581 [Kwoniella shandongensis]|uniref:Uncharacterized protein n=1 Tax=Kwoniella shandongensis TaxID=1734106 RepID=A0A5M6BZA1_9TREE|nr:uncharacterized protein CI109_003497 [Kwoniella shandongensis]KAA5528208.1 hypothetical protein CI109_003497 [Kwoniella shandongensis]